MGVCEKRESKAGERKRRGVIERVYVCVCVCVCVCDYAYDSQIIEGEKGKKKGKTREMGGMIA